MANKKLGILFLLTVLLAFFAGYFSSSLIPRTQFRTDDIFVTISQYLDDYYYYDLNDADERAAYIASIESIIQTYAKRHNDPYTRLEAIPLSTNPQSDESYVGLGVYSIFINQDVLVTDIIHRGPAFKKLYPNDLIIGVLEDGQEILFKQLSTTQQVIDQLTGKENDQKTLIVLDPDLNTSYVEITLKKISTPTVYSKSMNEADIGYIKINEFGSFIKNMTPGTASVFSDLLFDLEQTTLTQSAQTKTLIIDLRDNPGGALEALHNQGQTDLVPGIIQQLIPRNTEKPTFEMVTRNGSSISFMGGLLQPKSYIIKVLVNQYSASAAEVLAAALHISLDVTLYGENTFGKHVYQNVKHLFTEQNVRYNLVYTEGIWTYGDRLNVKDHVLPVTPIAQSQLRSIDMPRYEGEVSLNQVASSLGLYQKFLNAFYRFEGQETLRTDGYFDEKTQIAITDFQTRHDIPSTGMLDKRTAQVIHDLLMEIRLDLSYDQQLLTLIDIIKNS